jgi:hypothetical protein
MCIIDIFKAQRYVFQWVKQQWGILYTRNTYVFMGFPREKIFTLLETSVTPIVNPRVVPHKKKSINEHHSHRPIGI